MNINIHNYEQYFLDYHEGNLSPELRDEVIRFVTMHPDLEEEFHEFEHICLEPPVVTNFQKDFLKKEVIELSPLDERSIDDYLVAKHEGDLTIDQHSELKQFLAKNPAWNDDDLLYSRMKLQPEAIVFAGKQKLLQPVFNIRKVVVRAVAVAASVLLVSSLYFVFDKPDEKPLAGHESGSLVNETITRKNEAKVQNPQNIEIPPLEDEKMNKQEVGLAYKEQVIPDEIVEKHPETEEMKEDMPRLLELKSAKDDFSALAAYVPKAALVYPKVVPAIAAKDRQDNPARENPAVSVNINKEDLAWKLISATVKGFATISEKDVDINKNLEDKEAIEIAIETQRFGISGKIGKALLN